jgi:hypothetical protein
MCILASIPKIQRWRWVYIHSIFLQISFGELPL